MWVRGHQGDHFNERADELAGIAARGVRDGVATPTPAGQPEPDRRPTPAVQVERDRRPTPTGQPEPDRVPTLTVQAEPDVLF